MGDIAYAILESFMDALLQRLKAEFRRSGRSVATAESCTGGWLAKCLTDLPGASHWFRAGWVVYSNEAKQRDLGVRASTLTRHGAVSEAAVRELARAALLRSGSDYAIAISGIAGPDGAVPGKPVGTVWFAFAAREGRAVRLVTRQRRFRGDRGRVREQAVRYALRGLYSMARKGLLYIA
jgi:nicotinamide-nucleotide amidase